MKLGEWFTMIKATLSEICLTLTLTLKGRHYVGNGRNFIVNQVFIIRESKVFVGKK